MMQSQMQKLNDSGSFTIKDNCMVLLFKVQLLRLLPDFGAFDKILLNATDGSATDAG